MFTDTVYPHALEIQQLFMRALFENLIREPCTRKTQQTWKNQRKYQFEKRNANAKQRTSMKSNIPRAKWANDGERQTEFKKQRGIKRRNSHNPAHPIKNIATRANKRCNNNYKTISHFRPVHFKACHFVCAQLSVEVKRIFTSAAE